MDSYFTLPGVQLPFQRRLSRLYNDTKKSSDFVKEPVQNAEDPEIKALHRKLRIQKDRLVSWGLEWSDPSQSSEVLIDSSLSRAGLSEVVGSIMSTIKETLAEVEPLWLSSKQLVGGGGDDGKGSDGGGGGGGVGGDGSELGVPEKGSTAAAAAAADPDRKRPLVVTWDKARFADLVRDLTVSIDTLYDLSRTRASAGEGKGSSAAATKPPPQQQQHQRAPSPASVASPWAGGGGGSQESAWLFESARMAVPQQIDSATLTSIEPALVPRPPSRSAGLDDAALVALKTREVVFMSRQAYADLVGRPASPSYEPLLLEYAYFDPVYAATGILPSMARFEKLAAGLRGEAPQRLNPRLLGYFEDMDHARLGLVYQFPPGFHAIAAPAAGGGGAAAAAPSPATLRSCLYSLADLLGSPGFEPKLEAKFRLASNLANAVFEMHAKGIAHGNLVDAGILFGRVADPDPLLHPADVSQVDIRRPLITAFDLFGESRGRDGGGGGGGGGGRGEGGGSGNGSGVRGAGREGGGGLGGSGSSSTSLHQHPLNPASFAPGAPPIVDADPRVFDLYSLAMLLLSIGMWTRLENLVPHRDAAMVSEAVLDQLATQCGTLYMKAVQTCWNAMELVVSAGRAAGESHLARLQVRASSYLEACCVLDDVAALDARLRSDLGDDLVSPLLQAPSLAAQPQQAPPAPPPPPARPLRAQPRRTVPEPVRDDYAAALDAKPPPVPPKTTGLEIPPIDYAAAAAAAAAATAAAAPPPQRRQRLYPQVPLPPDVVEKWHTFLMPQVNAALRHFYRSHPESVEISLESVGESPRTTRPTVVVVCTSVAKVRSILKRKMGNVFEGANALGLKVCSGRVMRSRRRSGAGAGAGAGEEGASAAAATAAANGHFQLRPQNGASIGAWVGDRHLPPVSFGGLVLVDDQPFGMTVHHMLDDPEATEAAAREGQKALRSAASAAAASAAAAASGPDDEARTVEELSRSLVDWYAELHGGRGAANYDDEGGGDDDDDDDDVDSDGVDYACEFSDTDSAVSESDITSEWSDSASEGYDEDEADGGGREGAGGAGGEPGDVPGVEPGYGEGYVVTQPALDDVDSNFYPDAATQDDDHLDSCGLGDVYASSGVRRRVDTHGLVHEIDWALFAFKAERLPPANAIPHLPLGGGGGGGGGGGPTTSTEPALLHPTTVAPATALPGLEVQCMARTSGLQTGRILSTITSVKLYGRASPSHTYQISGAASAGAAAAGAAGAAGGGSAAPGGGSRPIGIPGDSGAWIVEREHGRLCGHVLAWSARKRVAYLCPMDVLLLDIAETLEAGEVRLPGGEAVVKIMDADEAAGATKVGAATTAAAEALPADAADLAEGVARAGRRPQLSGKGSSSLRPQGGQQGGGGSGSAGSAGSASGAAGDDGKAAGWRESTKMLELVGSMGSVRLDSGADVRPVV